MSENYLNKKDMLRFIHDSKATYTYYIDGTLKQTKYKDYDIILCGKDFFNDARNKLTLQLINTKRREKLLPRTSILRPEDIEMLDEDDHAVIKEKILYFDEEQDIPDYIIERAKLGHYNRKLYYNNIKRVRELPEDVDIPVENLVFRIFTYEHIPYKVKDATGKEKTIADLKQKINFPPYKHYAYIDGKLTEVAKSHYKKDGETFCTTHGYIVPPLAEAYLLQSRRVSFKHNTKGYSYIDDMVCNANLQLVLVGLQFNELFSDNPFSYFTSVITNSFKTVLKTEKKNQQFRDKLLMEAGYDPSMTAQINQENSRSEHWQGILANDELTIEDDNVWSEDTFEDLTDDVVEDLQDDFDKEETMSEFENNI